VTTTPLKLLSSMATRELLVELAARYARDCDQLVIAEATGGVDAARRVQAGEALDIVVLAANAIDKLIAAGKLVPGSRVDLVKSGVAVAVRAGTVAPDITSEEAVKRAVLAAKTLGYSTGPSGVYLEKLFKRWGILPAIKHKIIVAAPGIPVGSLVAQGECALGFQQHSELLNVQGIVVLGSLPEAIQLMTTFSGAVAANSQQPAAARRALDFMAAPAMTTIKQRYGMEAAASQQSTSSP
jgi:molybdate transport system substrate-binding protein